MSSSFAWVPPGLDNELSHLSLSEVCLHLRNYLGNFVLDDVAAIGYVNRLINDPQIQGHTEAVRLLYYSLVRTMEISPLEESVMSLVDMLKADDSIKQRLSLLKKLTPDPALRERAQRLYTANQNAQGDRLALQMLTDMPACVWAAVMLLRHDQDRGCPPGEWISKFQCLPKLAPFWNTMLFNHHALIGQHEKALELWEALAEDAQGPYSLNLAAEAYRATGEPEKAVILYMRSLKLDPLQQPIRYRLEALANPFVPERNLPDERTVNIYLYSWNKADFLEKTLLSLASTHIGNARIKVLLNGCTDDSQARVERIREEHFGDRLEIISLPVNIGAPAARNWLIAQPETLQADYTAFLDDDVDVEPDWLSSMLTVLEQHEKAGVVGCKIIAPGSLRRYQYLYRTPSVVRDDLFRISFDSPSVKFDTGLYDVIRPTANVMGCCHVFRRQALADCPTFDLRFSPSQMDDVAHDFELLLHGYEVYYCGHTSCVHHQNTGGARTPAQVGNTLGNDVKFYHKFYESREQMRQFMLS